MTEPIMTLMVDSMGLQALANLLRTVADDYPLALVEGTAGGLEIYPHGVGTRRRPFDVADEPDSVTFPDLPIPPAPFRCAVDGCGRSFPTRAGVVVHQARMHKANQDRGNPDLGIQNPGARPEPLAPPFDGGISFDLVAKPVLIEPKALPVSSWCRRGECRTCTLNQARCGHDCHPDSRQLPPHSGGAV